MKALLFLAVILSILSSVMFLPLAHAAERAVTAGYGFGALNDEQIQRTEGGRCYDFLQVAYLYEKPWHHPKVAVILEPFTAYVNRPESGVDIGSNGGTKWYPFDSGTGLYLSP